MFSHFYVSTDRDWKLSIQVEGACYFKDGYGGALQL